MGTSSKTPPVGLAIAGSDSGAGAGIQADIKTFSALGVYAATAITAVTAQNTKGVSRVQILQPDMVEAQIAAITSDFVVRATKVGMLGSFENVSLVARLAGEGQLEKLVVDPVMVAASGDRLMNPGVDRAYADLLFPNTLLLTPNLREAEVLLKATITSRQEMIEAAFTIRSTGPTFVLLKGGHFDGEESVDLLCDGNSVLELRAPRIATANLHGTGCTLSSAIAAHLAKGFDLVSAVKAGKAYVQRSIKGSARWAIGSGSGPLDHFNWSETS